MSKILITGSTDGIGKLAAIKLAEDGHEIYIHGRNAEKVDAVVEEIKAASTNENIIGFVADFSDMEAVKNMAKQVNETLPNLDVLINNAGVYKSPVAKTKDGYDIRYAVNYFAPYILTKTLLPLLKKSEAPRVINLSSAAQAQVSIDAMQGKVAMAEMEAYAQSKLAITMWSMYMAENESGILVIPVNPGSLLNTNMVREGWGFHRSSADKGRDILYDLAILDKYKTYSGKYYDNDRGGFGPIHPAGEDEDAVKVLVEKTEELISKW